MSLRLVRNGKALLGVVLALFLAAFLAACETSSGSSGGTEPRPTNELLFGFEVESVNIAEDFSQGDVVATAALTIDGEAPTAEQLNELVVSITPSDAPFALSVATGELRTTAPLDFETASSYALTIELTYAAGTPTSATLRVDLSNVDERSISYTLPDDGVIRVAEDIAAGSEVFSASITIDGEPVAAEDGLSLALEPSDAPFAIDNAGTITTTAALDYETTARYEITLVASAVDGSLRLPFVIEVDNVARPISYALPDPVSISEASAVGTALFSPQVLVGGEAPTAADGLKFTLTPNPPSSEGVPFAIDSTGTIITTDDLDYEGTTSSYDVSLSVASSTNNDIVAFSADFTIAVEDVVEQEGSRNLAIAFNPVSPVDVAESAANGDTVSTASVLVDGAAPTTADGVTFSLGTTDVPFEIDSSTGEITTTAALDYEDTTSYTLTVVANAVNANTASTNLLVNVTNVFENTLVLAAQTLSIAEDASGGDSVGTLTASVSPSGSVTFVDPGDSRFAVNPTTGEVTLKSGASLDHETTPSYTLEVAASSPDADGVQATITINVTNVLESTITFAAQTLSIPENSAAGTSAGSLTAAIAPAVGVTFGGPNSYFAVASDGEVTVKDGASIDYETLPNSYVFTVTASNDDALSVTATITVTVSDIEQEGTALEPFAVSSLSELQSIATGFSNLYVGSNCAYILGCSEGSLSAAASLKQTYSLGANIDVSDTSDADYNSATGTTGGGTGDVGNGFLPIGSCGSDCGNTDAPAPFSGSFDGQGYEITGLHIERDATGSLRGAGLFSSLSGRVENLRLQELSVHGDAYTGAVAGHVTGTGALSEVFVQGVVEGDNAPTGGLVGELWGSIEDSAVLGLVRGTSNTGGLVGLNESNSSTTGSIVRSLASVYLAASGTKGGGLVGENRGNISSSFANATVYGVSGSPHGGLIGQQDGGQVEHCYATGAVISSGATAGGLIGNFSFGSFSDCYASVLARGVSNVGGLVGQGLGSVSDIRSYWNTDQTSAGVGLELPGTGISGDTGLTFAELQALTCTGASSSVFEDGEATCSVENTFPWSFGGATDTPVLEESGGMIGGLLDATMQRALIDFGTPRRIFPAKFSSSVSLAAPTPPAPQETGNTQAYFWHTPESFTGVSESMGTLAFTAPAVSTAGETEVHSVRVTVVEESGSQLARLYADDFEILLGDNFVEYSADQHAIFNPANPDTSDIPKAAAEADSVTLELEEYLGAASALYFRGRADNFRMITVSDDDDSDGYLDIPELFVTGTGTLHILTWTTADATGTLIVRTKP